MPNFPKWYQDLKLKELEEKYLPVRYSPPLQTLSRYSLEKDHREAFAHIRGDDGNKSFEYNNLHPTVINNSRIKVFLN